MDKCKKCGHVRHPFDLFDEECDTCCFWVQARVGRLEIHNGNLITQMRQMDKELRRIRKEE